MLRCERCQGPAVIMAKHIHQTSQDLCWDCTQKVVQVRLTRSGNRGSQTDKEALQGPYAGLQAA